MSAKFGEESKFSRLSQKIGEAMDITTGATGLPLLAAKEWALDIESAYFLITTPGTGAASAVSIKLGIVGDDDEFSATCALPAGADMSDGDLIPIHLGSDVTLEKGEVMEGTTVTLTNGPTGHYVINYGVGNQ